MSIIGGIVAVIGLLMTIITGIIRSSDDYQIAKGFSDYFGVRSSEIAAVEACFVIGIIALVGGIILVVLGSMNKSGRSRGFSSPKTIVNVNVPPYTAPKKFVCTKCGTDVSADMMFCPNCGSAEKTEKNATVQQAPAFCPGCGASVNPGEAFCHQCGTKI